MSPGIGSLNRARSCFRVSEPGAGGPSERRAGLPLRLRSPVTGRALTPRVGPTGPPPKSSVSRARQRATSGPQRKRRYPTGVPGGQRHVPALWRSSPTPAFPTAVFPRLATGLARGVGRTVPPPSPPRPAALKDAGPGMPPRHRTPFCHKTDETQRQLNSLAPVGLRESRFRRASLGVRSQSPSPAPREQRLPAPIVRDLLRVTVPPRTRAAAPGRDAERTASHHRSHSESKLVTPAHAWHRTHRTSPHTQPRHHPTCPARDLQPPAPAWPPGFCKCSSLLRSLVII